MIKKYDDLIVDLMYREGTRFERILAYLCKVGHKKDLEIVQNNWSFIWGKYQKKFNKTHHI